MVENTTQKEFIIKSSIFDRNRKFTLDSSYIEFENDDLKSSKPFRISKNDIEAFRYGIQWISGYVFVIGRTYCIDIKYNSNKIIKIRLRSIYGINKKNVWEKYSQILRTLFDNYFDAISGSYLDNFAEGKEILFPKIKISSSGILLLEKNIHLPWEDIGTKHYASYYSIFSKSKPTIYQSFEFINDWNTAVIYSVSRQILSDKGFYTQ